METETPKRKTKRTLNVVVDNVLPSPTEVQPAQFAKLKMTAKVIAALSAILIFVQFIFEVKRWDNSPATYLVLFKDHFLDFWEWAGRTIAHLSSYLDWLEWRAVYDTFVHLFTPLLEMCLFVAFFAKGYLLTAYEYNHRLSIFVGTLIPLILLEEYLRRKTTFFSFLKQKYESLRGPNIYAVEWYTMTVVIAGLVFAFCYFFVFFSPLGYSYLFAGNISMYPSFLK